MATTAPDKQREQDDTRSSRSPTSDDERGAVHAQRGRRLPPLTVAVAVGLVVVAALAVWAIFVRSDETPPRSAPANQQAAIAGEASGLPDPAALNEPMLVVERYVESLNRGDTSGALAAFVPDAELISPGCQPTCFGIAAIAPVLEQTATNRGQLVLTDPRVEGDTLTANFTFASQEFPDGVERVTGSMTAVVRNQRIMHLSMYWDPTDPQTAIVLNALNQAAVTLSAGDCTVYWTQAETLTGVPRDVQAGMNAIGYASVGAPQLQHCPPTP
jgi:hypothetical protein